jgi:hypothetical protein
MVALKMMSKSPAIFPTGQEAFCEFQGHEFFSFPSQEFGLTLVGNDIESMRMAIVRAE